MGNTAYQLGSVTQQLHESAELLARARDQIENPISDTHTKQALCAQIGRLLNRIEVVEETPRFTPPLPADVQELPDVEELPDL